MTRVARLRSTGTVAPPPVPASTTTSAAADAGADQTQERLAAVAAELHTQFCAVIAVLAGTPPRPVRLMRRIGLDKSLASRLVQAVRAESALQFLHAAPSPTGLRIVLYRGATELAPELLRAAAAAVDGFESLLDTLPGGRQALDARLGTDSADLRRKREHAARQTSFKAQCFLYGHYCDTVATTLFIVPSATPGKVDLLEVHRRLGLQRLMPDAAVPLMSLAPSTNPSAAEACMTDLAGDAATRRPEDFLLPGASSSPLPRVRVVDEGSMVSFVLEPAPPGTQAERLTTAFRVLRVADVEQAAAFHGTRRYMLHMPCATLVRDVYLAAGLWPGAQLHADFFLPGPTGTPGVVLEPGKPHHRRMNLSCQTEPLPPGAPASELPGAADHAQLLRDVLARVGLQGMSFRGWRCTMAYPVPLVEMQLGFRFDGQA